MVSLVGEQAEVKLTTCSRENIHLAQVGPCRGEEGLGVRDNDLTHRPCARGTMSSRRGKSLIGLFALSDFPPPFRQGRYHPLHLLCVREPSTGRTAGEPDVRITERPCSCFEALFRPWYHTRSSSSYPAWERDKELLCGLSGPCSSSSGSF